MSSLTIVYVSISQASGCYRPNPCFLIWKIKNTMVGLMQRRPTIFRRQEKWVVDVDCEPDATDGVCKIIHSKIFIAKRPANATHICEDILMRNGCMECFRSEAYWQVRRNDKNTKSAVYRKIDRKYPKWICLLGSSSIYPYPNAIYSQMCCWL